MRVVTGRPESYEVAPRLSAGAYPGSSDPEQAATRLAHLEAAGVTLVIDLTQDGELPPYAALLRAARHVRHPIPDMAVATAGTIVATLDLVDAELARGGHVYVHCWGGVGRTGTVVGCWLRRHGLDDGDPIGRIASLRAHLRTAWMSSPQTPEQCDMVLGWPPGR